MSTYDAQRNNNSDRVAQKYVDLEERVPTLMFKTLQI